MSKNTKRSSHELYREATSKNTEVSEARDAVEELYLRSERTYLRNVARHKHLTVRD